MINEEEWAHQWGMGYYHIECSYIGAMSWTKSVRTEECAETTAATQGAVIRSGGKIPKI